MLSNLQSGTFLILIMALSGWISTTKRGSILAGIVVLYSLTSIVGGYISTRLYFQMNGKMWARCVLMTTILFPKYLFEVDVDKCY